MFLITDNILVAYMCFHTIKNKRESKGRLCAIKLDIHKAYGRVEWPFLKDIIPSLGFRENLVNFICNASQQLNAKFGLMQRKVKFLCL